MRQHDYIFDILNLRIGVARSKCNDDPNMIMTVNDYYEYGNLYGIDVNETNKVDPDFIHCDHEKKKTNNYAAKYTEYVATENSKPTQGPSNDSPFAYDNVPGESIWDSKFLKNILRTISGVITLFCVIFVCLFVRELCKYIWHRLTKEGPYQSSMMIDDP